MSRFGFCDAGHHDRCPGSYRPFFFEGKRLIYRDADCVCTCLCHTKENDTT